MKEPATVITDYLLGALSAVLGVLLLRAEALSAGLWGAALLAAACAAFLGGTHHGWGGAPAWKLTLYAIGAGSFFMLAGSAVATLPPGSHGWFLAAAALKLVAYLARLRRDDSFRLAVLDYAPSLLVVGVLHAYALWAGHGAGAVQVMAGILVSFAAAAVQRSGFALHRHFNHNDLYHVIQMAAIYLFYSGALQFSDR